MYIRQLTFTRFFAAIAIVVFHYGQSIYPFDTFIVHKFVRIANSAVSFFFVLSGFVMVVAYYKKKKDFNKAKYYLARFFRIYPAYIVGLFLVIFYLAKYYPSGIRGVISHVFLLQAWFPNVATALNTPGWTLSVEVFFYLLFPLIFIPILRLSQRGIIFLAAISWIINLGIHVYLYQNFYSYHHVIFYNPVLHLLTFVQGMCFGILFMRLQQREMWKKYSFVMVLASISVFCLFVLFSEDWYQYHHNGMFALLFGVFIFALSLNDGFLKKVFSWKPFVFFGEISYGIYILQVPVYYFFFKFLVKFNIQLSPQYYFWVYCVSLILFSAALYVFFENPLRNLLRKIFYRG